MTGPRRIVEDVQRFGLSSAASVVDRYIDLAGRALGDSPLPSPAVSDAVGSRPVDDSAARLTQTVLALLDAAADLGAVSGGGRDDSVVLPPATPGSTTVAPAWVHNTKSGQPSVVVTASSLVGASGQHVPHAAVSVSPATAKVSSVGPFELQVRVDVPDGQAPGLYHGLLLLSAAPDDPVTLVLRVVGR